MVRGAKKEGKRDRVDFILDFRARCRAVRCDGPQQRRVTFLFRGRFDLFWKASLHGSTRPVGWMTGERVLAYSMARG